MVSTRIVLLDSDSLIFFISNTILSVCCVIFNMSTLLIIHICLHSFMISYFLFMILLSFREQKIVLMFLSYASVSSFPCDSISYFALDMLSALHIVYVPHLSLYIYYIMISHIYLHVYLYDRKSILIIIITYFTRHANTLTKKSLMRTHLNYRTILPRVYLTSMHFICFYKEHRYIGLIFMYILIVGYILYIMTAICLSLRRFHVLIKRSALETNSSKDDSNLPLIH